MSCGTAFSDQQSFNSLCRCLSKTGLPHFMISGGMPLLPVAFPLVRQWPFPVHPVLVLHLALPRQLAGEWHLVQLL